MKKIFIVLMLVVCLQGCEDISVLLEPDHKIVLAVEDATQAEDVRKVLHRRFDQNRAYLFTSIESKVVDGNIEIVFLGGAPSRETVNELVNTRGEYRLVTDSGVVLIDSSHIITAGTTTQYDQLALTIGLNEAGGSRVHSWTSRNVGKNLTAMFDDRMLVTAIVKGPFGSRYQTTMDMPKKELDRIADIISSGSLKTKVTVVDYGKK
jgi:preprotein translocase subunit SecD